MGGQGKWKKKTGDAVSYQDGAGGLLLVAAAHETGLLEHLEGACHPAEPCGVQARGSQQEEAGPRRQPGKKSLRRRLLTLLLLGVCGLRRTWDLRSYTGDGLGLLIGRKQAYGYAHAERALSKLARDAPRLTEALGKWTQELWESSQERSWYVDGHRKSVYTQSLIPRSLVGRTGKLVGCRGLMLLHDQQGHPRLALTGRGDWHVMDGLQEIVSTYEQISGQPLDKRIVVDREGMGATFLKKLKDEGRCVVTLLRSNQYHGLESFWDVGAFVPLSRDSHGTLTREVAPARFALALPDEPAEVLPVQVALIRDLRPGPAAIASGGQEADLSTSGQIHPSARLIPIITTDPGPLDALCLAQTYIHRWPAQENVIKDYLLPLGLDTNHGFTKTPVVNSEVAKKRETSQKHLETFKKWMASAQTKHHKMIYSKSKLVERIEIDEQQYQLLITQQEYLDKDSVNSMKHYNKLQKKIIALSLQQEKRKMREHSLSLHISEQHEKCQHYAQKQCDLLHFLENLGQNERTMYELDNRKDQVMTVFKVALANLAMWTRDQYFPDTYSNATWERIAPFFRLPGIVRSNQQTVDVELRPFNDRQYNRDLSLLCQRINQKQPHLPDGRLLTFSVRTASRSSLDGQMPLLA
jgi:hypothetical protein